MGFDESCQLFNNWLVFFLQWFDKKMVEEKVAIAKDVTEVSYVLSIVSEFLWFINLNLRCLDFA